MAVFDGRRLRFAVDGQVRDGSFTEVQKDITSGSSSQALRHQVEPELFVTGNIRSMRRQMERQCIVDLPNQAGPSACQFTRNAFGCSRGKDVDCSHEEKGSYSQKHQ